MPHATGACNYAIQLRHMLVHEQGDELHLLKAVPDGWLAEGQEIRLERLPTYFGEIGLTIRGTGRGVQVRLDKPARDRPGGSLSTCRPTSRGKWGSRASRWLHDTRNPADGTSPR